MTSSGAVSGFPRRFAQHRRRPSFRAGGVVPEHAAFAGQDDSLRLSFVVPITSVAPSRRGTRYEMAKPRSRGAPQDFPALSGEWGLP